jgi:hypothetical protein
MELKPGYKQTEVGVIPEDWDVKRLWECATFRTGPFGSALHKSDYITDGVPLVNPMHIVNGGDQAFLRSKCYGRSRVLIVRLSAKDR